MPRRSAHVIDSFYLMNTAHIVKESIRVMLLHSTHFQSISVFLFSPYPISLFISHFLVRRFPSLDFSAISITDPVLPEHEVLPLLNLLSKTTVHIIICFPSSITFSLLGRAATFQAVSDSYGGINLDGRTQIRRSGLAWIRLLYTSFWEFLILLLLGAFASIFATITSVLIAYGLHSVVFGFWLSLGFLGIPFCLGFAHVMVVGNLAKVLAVLENDCYGFESLVRANDLMKGRRQRALAMALLSNMGFNLVEFLFEYRMSAGINLWEVPLLVSMYCMVLVFDNVMNAVFYYSCKS